MSKNIDTIDDLHGPFVWFHRFRKWLRGLSKAPGRAPSRRQVPTPPAPGPALLMVSRDIGPLVDRTVERLAEWHNQHDGRRQLMGLDDRHLKDLGISRCDAEREYRKPFWRT